MSLIKDSSRTLVYRKNIPYWFRALYVARIYYVLPYEFNTIHVGNGSYGLRMLRVSLFGYQLRVSQLKPSQIYAREYEHKYIADADLVLKSRRPQALDILACGSPASGTELHLALKPTHRGRPSLFESGDETW